MKSKIEYIWHRIKMGQTLNSIAKRNGIEDWKVLYEHNRDLLRNPNILNYIDEDIYDIGWCINNKQGVVRIPVLNSQDQEENEPEKVYVDPIVPDFIAEKLAEERYNTREILLNGTKPLEVEDTPEERGIAGTTDDDMKGITPEESEVQEWEEGWHSTPVYNQISFIKNLLEEREDRAREEVMFTEDEQRVLRFALKLQRDDIHKVWDEETFGTIWKKVGGLSKLTTK